jgi:hypothetical protein
MAGSLEADLSSLQTATLTWGFSGFNGKCMGMQSGVCVAGCWRLDGFFAHVTSNIRSGILWHGILRARISGWGFPTGVCLSKSFPYTKLQVGLNVNFPFPPPPPYFNRDWILPSSFSRPPQCQILMGKLSAVVEFWHADRRTGGKVVWTDAVQVSNAPWVSVTFSFWFLVWAINAWIMCIVMFFFSL